MDDSRADAAEKLPGLPCNVGPFSSSVKSLVPSNDGMAIATLEYCDPSVEVALSVEGMTFSFMAAASKRETVSLGLDCCEEDLLALDPFLVSGELDADDGCGATMLVKTPGSGLDGMGLVWLPLLVRDSISIKELRRRSSRRSLGFLNTKLANSYFIGRSRNWNGIRFFWLGLRNEGLFLFRNNSSKPSWGRKGIFWRSRLEGRRWQISSLSLQRYHCTRTRDC